MFNNWFRKEKPIQGLMGMGGGATGFLLGGAGGGFEATGGTIVDDGGYRYHVFTSPGTFSITGDATIDNLLVVAAGGNGGQSRAGGGGGGGVRNLSNVPVTAQSYPIQIGQTNGQPHGRGGPSSGLGYSATGGGAMEGDTGGPGLNHPRMNGGCGSGGPGNTSGYGYGNQGGYSPPEGFNGGNGSGAIGGGGGGAGGAGVNAPGPYPNPGVRGGPGALIPWVPGSYGENRRFAGGGSSTGYDQPCVPPIGGGGGGAGRPNALTNTGGGGGCGGAGAPGIVILRYAA